jgi:hypothetical protein
VNSHKFDIVRDFLFWNDSDYSYKIEGKKGKVVPVLFYLTKHHAMKPYWGSEGIAPIIL